MDVFGRCFVVEVVVDVGMNILDSVVVVVVVASSEGGLDGEHWCLVVLGEDCCFECLVRWNSVVHRLYSC